MESNATIVGDIYVYALHLLRNGVFLASLGASIRVLLEGVVF